VTARKPSTEDIDRGELREKVSRWLDEHPDGTEDELIEALAGEYPDHKPGDVAVVLRNVLFAEIRGRQR
jgi:hypothetical protein